MRFAVLLLAGMCLSSLISPQAATMRSVAVAAAPTSDIIEVARPRSSRHGHYGCAVIAHGATAIGLGGVACGNGVEQCAGARSMVAVLTPRVLRVVIDLHACYAFPFDSVWRHKCQGRRLL